MTPDEYARNILDPRKREIIISVYKEYEQELKKCNALDFDDLLNKTYDLLSSSPETLEYYQNKHELSFFIIALKLSVTSSGLFLSVVFFKLLSVVFFVSKNYLLH